MVNYIFDGLSFILDVRSFAMNVKNEIRSHLASVGITVSSLEKKMLLTRGTIQQMLDRGSLKYEMANSIAQTIGKKIVWENK